MKLLAADCTPSIRSTLQSAMYDIQGRVLSGSLMTPAGVYAVVLALLLPGSFVVLPLIWLWHRRNAAVLCEARKPD